MTRDELIRILSTVDELPNSSRGNGRTVYQAASEGFYTDYSSYPGGSTERVPLSLIEQLESDGTLVKTFPDAPQVKSWRLAK